MDNNQTIKKIITMNIIKKIFFLALLLNATMGFTSPVDSFDPLPKASLRDLNARTYNAEGHLVPAEDDQSSYLMMSPMDLCQTLTVVDCSDPKAVKAHLRNIFKQQNTPDAYKVLSQAILVLVKVDSRFLETNPYDFPTRNALERDEDSWQDALVCVNMQITNRQSRLTAKVVNLHGSILTLAEDQFAHFTLAILEGDERVNNNALVLTPHLFKNVADNQFARPLEIDVQLALQLGEVAKSIQDAFNDLPDLSGHPDENSVDSLDTCTLMGFSRGAVVTQDAHILRNIERLAPHATTPFDQYVSIAGLPYVSYGRDHPMALHSGVPITYMVFQDDRYTEPTTMASYVESLQQLNPYGTFDVINYEGGHASHLNILPTWQDKLRTVLYSYLPLELYRNLWPNGTKSLWERLQEGWNRFTLRQQTAEILNLGTLETSHLWSLNGRQTSIAMAAENLSRATLAVEKGDSFFTDAEGNSSAFDADHIREHIERHRLPVCVIDNSGCSRVAIAVRLQFVFFPIT